MTNILDYKQHIQQGHSVTPEEVLEHKKEIESAGLWADRVFLLPSELTERIKLLVMLSKQGIENLPEMRTGSRAEYAFDDALRSKLKVLSSCLVYLMNSTSFREGKLQTFDNDEINRKLGIKDKE